MKKCVSIILAVLAICLFAGCVEEAQQPASDGGSVQVVTAPTAADENNDKDVAGQLAGLNACLDDIRETVQPGTAGGSLRSAASAAKLMDWGVSCKLDAEQIAAQIDNYTINMSEADKDEFGMQLEAVKGAYLLLLTEGQEGILSDAGVTDSGYPYGSDPIPAVEAVFSAAGIE